MKKLLLLFIGLKFFAIIIISSIFIGLFYTTNKAVYKDVIPINKTQTNTCKCNCTESELIELQRDFGVSADKACDLCCQFHEIAN